MRYPAREIYQDKRVVKTYEVRRFKTLKGYFVDKREKYLIGKALKYAAITPPAIILDVPCGTGRVSIYLAKKGFKVKAVDLSSEMVRLARKKIKDQNLIKLIKLNVGDAESLPYTDNSFDVVVCLRLFGHTPSEVRRKILQELKRVVKNYLVLVYYHKNCLQYFLRKRRRNEGKIEWHPVTYKQIENELKTAGIKKVKYFPLFRKISETIVVLTRKEVGN